MKTKFLLISLMLLLGTFSAISQKELKNDCSVTFSEIEQICGEDGKVELTFKLEIDYPSGSDPCFISKIEIEHAAVIGEDPLEDPTTICIEDFSSNMTYTIGGAVSDRENCYNVSLIDAEGNVCCYTLECVMVDDLDCCDLDVIINTYCAPLGHVRIEILGGTAPFQVFGAALVDSDVPEIYEEVDLDAGTYNLFIKDSNGCTFETTYTIPHEDSEECCDLDVLITTNCAPQGSVRIEILGGSAPFNVTGAVLVDSDVPEIYEEVELDAGTYPLTIEDSNGCTFETTYTILEGPHVDIDVNGCSPFAWADITVTGGSGDYKVIGGSEIEPGIYEETDLVSGTYYVVVIDSDGCEVRTSYTVPENLQANIVSFTEDCEVIVSLSGGTAPYYINSDNSIPSNNGVFTVSLIYDIDGWPADLVFTDDNGCVTTITINEDDVPEGIDCSDGLKSDQDDKKLRTFDNHDLSNTTSIYPSPVLHILYIDMVDSYQSTDLKIMSNTGAILLTKRFSNQNKLRVETSSIPPGIYFIHICNDKEAPIIQRFVKN